MWLRWISWDLDFTGVQMILTIKLTSIGYNYYDGYVGDKQTDPYKRAHAVKTLPSPLEYFGWIFFFPSFLTGPSIEYAEYRDYINLSMFPNKVGGV
jgi:lysophospholipid acyltransferase